MNVDAQSKSNEPAPLWSFVAYFLRLGTFGFGGPIALASRMETDLVHEKKWIEQGDYLQGLALAQLAPGPLAAQLAMYLGYVRAGVMGASLVGIAFVLPSFLMVLAVSALYVRYDGLPQLQAVFYGIGAAVVAIILRSVIKLGRSTLKRDKVLWTIATVLAVSTAITGREIFWLFLLGGLCSLVVKTGVSKIPATLCLIPAVPISVQWLQETRFQVFWFFLKSSLFVFGSGLAIVPFLHGGVVETHHWLNERQFLDAIAVAMITPGPVVITVAFIGYLVDGLPGAVLAAAGVFVPVYVVVLTSASFYRRISKNIAIQAFVKGVTAAATGAIAGSVFVIARHSIYDVQTVVIFGLTAIVLWRWKIPEPILVATSGVIGLILFSVSR
ncbi:MAG: chromate transporter [Acidobacteriales bacterium 59-55]|nr:chromate efflux transporter [Terriglobales bacterium]OJV40202.1 MAG: chromate transporter [Acidobacteriales bacterium 59-55]